MCRLGPRRADGTCRPRKTGQGQAQGQDRKELQGARPQRRQVKTTANTQGRVGEPFPLHAMFGGGDVIRSQLPARSTWVRA